MQASYEKTLKRCARGWRATGDPAFAIEAFIYTYLFRQPPELGLTEVICTVLTKRRTKGQATRAFRNAIRRMRYDAVCLAQRDGLTWDNAYERASKHLAKTAARCKASTMEAAYKKMVKDLKRGRGGQYITPNMPRKDVGDVLRRKPSPRG